MKNDLGMVPGKLYMHLDDATHTEEILALSVDERWLISWANGRTNQRHRPLTPPAGKLSVASDTDIAKRFEEWVSNSAPRHHFNEDFLLADEWGRIKALWWAEVDRRVDFELPLPHKYIPHGYARNRKLVAAHTDTWKVLARCLLHIDLRFFSVDAVVEDKQSRASLRVNGGYMRLDLGEGDEGEPIEFVSRKGSIRHPDSIGQLIDMAPPNFRYLLQLIRQALRALDTKGGSGSLAVDAAVEGMQRAILKTAMQQLSDLAVRETTLVERVA